MLVLNSCTQKFSVMSYWGIHSLHLPACPHPRQCPITIWTFLGYRSWGNIVSENRVYATGMLLPQTNSGEKQLLFHEVKRLNAVKKCPQDSIVYHVSGRKWGICDYRKNG